MHEPAAEALQELPWRRDARVRLEGAGQAQRDLRRQVVRQLHLLAGAGQGPVPKARSTVGRTAKEKTTGCEVKNLKLGTLSIPITQYASQGNAVLGIRDSGKSYSATYLAEQLYAAGIPFVAFDPSGVWKFLRVPGAGAGLPVVVAGGKVPDLPLTPHSAPEIVRAAMRANVSVVFDLYDIHMSKADWSRIVEACVRVLLYENGEHGLRHVFIEEAPEFAPQIVTQDKARVYAEVEKLARIGGNALLGYTLVGQRAEQVNKAVLELCDCLFLHRQKGKNSIKSLEKWLELSTGGDVKSIIAGLPKLPTGECWVWPANADHAMHVKMPQKNTFHPDRRQLIANPAAANVKRIDASAFVSELKGSLEKYVEEAKANDPAELKRQIRELQRDLAAAKSKNPDVEQIRAADLRRQLEEAKREGIGIGVHSASAAIAGKLSAVIKAGDDMVARLRVIAEEAAAAPSPTIPHRATTVPRQIPRGQPPEPSRLSAAASRALPRAAPTESHSNGSLSAAARKILGVLSQFPEGCRANKLTLLTGYKYSGSFQNALSELRTAGLIEGGNTETMQITDAGLAHGPFPELPSGRALGEYWLQHPSFGKAARDILRNLLESSDGMTADELCEATGYSYSGSFQNALSELRTAGVLVGRNTERMRASEDLF